MIDGELVKKRKIRREESRRPGSRIFSPFRSLGHVTNDLPFTVTSLGKTFVIATSVGRNIQIYDASNLHLLFVTSPQTPEEITCIQSNRHLTYASWGHSFGIFKRGRLVSSTDLSLISEDEPFISQIEVFGEYVCVGTSNVIYVYRHISQQDVEFYTSVTLPLEVGDVKQLLHMPTYLNKLLIMTETHLVLVNIRTSKIIFTTEPFESTLQCVTSAPVLDVVGIGCADGSVIIYNLRQGNQLFALAAGSRINSLSFGTDQSSHLAVGLASGDIYFYNLNSKRRLYTLSEAHSQAEGGVSCVHFLAGQAILVSTGGDNSLREFVFDPAVSTSTQTIGAPPRPLRSRGGHSLPPTKIEFADPSGHHLLSASNDRSLWSFSLRKDAQSHEFSQRETKTNGAKKTAGPTSGFKEKLPAITALAYRATRQGDWENILTCHKELSYAHTWDGRKGRAGRWHLRTLDGAQAKAVFVTNCGNFGLVGSSQGSIAVYNLQSGILRKKFSGHSKAITGIVVDSSNQFLFSSSLDGHFNIYDFNKKVLIASINVGCPITSLIHHSSTDLVGLILDNFSIAVIDTVTHRIVRELWGHSNRITAADFSCDARWIISASLDSSIRTWDLPTGMCIDAFKLSNIVTDLKLSRDGEWLATAHVDGVGISLWSNRSQFRSVAIREIDENDIQSMDMPSISGESSGSMIEGALDEDDKDYAADGIQFGVYNSVDQISKDLYTLSLVPRNKFNTLVNLERIKLRNRPKEPPAKPKLAPFFLPSGGDTVNGSKEEVEVESSMQGIQVSDAGVRSHIQADMTVNEFSRRLRALQSAGLSNVDVRAQEFVDYLKSLSPSEMDLEIRSLSYSDNEFVLFVQAMSDCLERKVDFELVQAWMGIFIQVHGDEIYQGISKKSQESPLADALQHWQKLQETATERLNRLVEYCAGVSTFIRTA